MFLKIKTIKFIIVMLVAGLSLVSNTFAQSSWLDRNSFQNWNKKTIAISQTKKIAKNELQRCAAAVRQPTLPVDVLLADMGWTLVGAAQVYGKTTVVLAAGALDGMCRPQNFQAFVFVGNSVVGTLSPSPMNSRAEGSLVNVELENETKLTAEYARYRESDPLCCPYKTNAVTFNIKPVGNNFLLTMDAPTSSGD